MMGVPKAPATAPSKGFPVAWVVRAESSSELRFGRRGVPSCSEDIAPVPPGAFAEATAPVPCQPPGLSTSRRVGVMGGGGCGGAADERSASFLSLLTWTQQPPRVSCAVFAACTHHAVGLDGAWISAVVDPLVDPLGASASGAGRGIGSRPGKPPHDVPRLKYIAPRRPCP